MTKLEELEATRGAAWRVERDAGWAVKVAWEDDDAPATVAAANVWVACVAAYTVADFAYKAEIKKQQENSDD